MNRSRVIEWGLALAIWTALSVSVGWYYTFTYYGHTGLPVPTPEVMGSLVLYYFSVLNVETPIQAAHWVIVFPLTGALWVWCLKRVAKRLGAGSVSSAALALRVGMTSLPLVALLPWMGYVAGATDRGFSWERMLAVALRRGFVTPWPGLNVMYLGLGVVVLVLQLWVVRKMCGLTGRGAVVHAATALILLTLAVAVVGALAALPLRYALE